MKYPGTITHRGMEFRGHVNKHNLVIYRVLIDFGHRVGTELTIGILSLAPGWQDADRTYTAQDIYWEDKYDCLAA